MVPILEPAVSRIVSLSALRGYTPTYTIKGKSIYYRYYLCKETGHRIKGQDLEALVFDVLRALSSEPKHWQACWRSSDNGMMVEELQDRWQRVWSRWAKMPAKTQLEIAQHVIERILVTEERLIIRLNYLAIIKAAGGFESAGGQDEPDTRDTGFLPEITTFENSIEITVRAKFQTYGRTQMALDEHGKPVRVFNKAKYNPTLVNALVKSYRWNRMLEAGQTTVTDLAKEARLSRTYISRIVSLAFLAPDIVTSVMTGTQSPKLQLQNLLENLPAEWDSQKSTLGIA